MSLSTDEVVREVHRVAVEEKLKRDLVTPEEYARFAEIVKDAAHRLDAERDAFRDRYQDRLVKAEEVVMREQAGRFLDHPKPSWAEDAVMSGDRIEILAHNRVLADHEMRKRVIRSDQMEAYLELDRDVRARVARETEARGGRTEGHLRETFGVANEISPHEAITYPQTRGRSGPSRSR